MAKEIPSVGDSRRKSEITDAEIDMDEPAIPAAKDANETFFDDDAEDVAVALVSMGWPVSPHGPEMAFWRIGDLILTDDELIGFAVRQGATSSSL